MIKNLPEAQAKLLPSAIDPEYKPGDAFEKLSARDKEFLFEYIAQHANGTRAYLALHPRSTYKTARTEAGKLLAKPYLRQAVIDEYQMLWRRKEAEEAVGETFQQVHSLASSDIFDVVDCEGTSLVVKSLKEIPPYARAAIQSIKKRYKETDSGVEEFIEVTMHSKLKALELKARIQKILDNKVQVGPIDIIIRPPKRPTPQEVAAFKQIENNGEEEE
jgi:hypothetical protein